jgi:thymidine phosphorylase
MHSLRVKKIGIDTYKENIAYMPLGCEICKSQGFGALSKIEIHFGGHSILATLNMTENGIVKSGEIGLSSTAFIRLAAPDNSEVTLSHPDPLISTDYIREKLDGKTLSKKHFLSIVRDILAHRYSNIELTAFVIACLKQRLNKEEIVSLTEAMIETGDKIDWGLPMVLDKHCVGGLPGNRTTMVVVPIIAAFGLPIPKTSSRAITSPSGTADAMETITNVRLTLAEMKKIVAEENACIAWGGSLSLAPVDDIIISVERPLNLDSEGQMVASILSKKKAAGSTHMVLDIPIGPTAKVKSKPYADRLKSFFEYTGKKIGLTIRVVYTDGSQPIGRGIGPALEAKEVLKVLKMDPDAPQDLKDKSIYLAGELLELSGKVKKGQGKKTAQAILESGQALDKFERIVQKQGGSRKPEVGAFSHTILSIREGQIKSIHNHKIANVAKLAGAPHDPGAGVYLHAKLSARVKKGQELYTVYAENEEELQFALHYSNHNPDIMEVV